MNVKCFSIVSFDIHRNIMIHILPQFNLASLKDCTEVEVFHVSAILLGLSLFQISSFKYPANVLIIQLEPHTCIEGHEEYRLDDEYYGS